MCTISISKVLYFFTPLLKWFILFYLCSQSPIFDYPQIHCPHPPSSTQLLHLKPQPKINPPLATTTTKQPPNHKTHPSNNQSQNKHQNPAITKPSHQITNQKTTTITNTCKPSHHKISPTTKSDPPPNCDPQPTVTRWPIVTHIHWENGERERGKSKRGQGREGWREEEIERTSEKEWKKRGEKPMKERRKWEGRGRKESPEKELQWIVINSSLL